MKFPLKVVVSIFILTLSAYLIFSTVTAIPHAWSSIPEGDLWGFPTKLLSNEDGIWSAIWGQHNEHKLLTLNVILLIDYLLFSNSQYFSLSAVLIQYAAIATILGYFLSKELDSVLLKIVGYAGAFAVCLSAVQGNNLFSPTGNSFTSVNLFMLLAMLCAFKFGEKKHGLLWIVLSVLSGALSLYSMVNGIFVLPLIIILILWYERNLKKSLVLSIATCFICFFFFFRHYEFASSSHHDFSRFDRIILFALTYLGGPFYYKDWIWGSVLMGAVGTLIFISYFFLTIWKGIQQRSILLIGCAAFFFLTIGVISAARSQEWGLMAAFTSRYYTLTLLTWGVLFAMMLHSGRVWFPKYRSFLFGAVSCLAILLLANLANRQPHSLEHIRAQKKKLDILEVALQTEVIDIANLKILSPTAAYREQAHQHELQLLKSRKMGAYGKKKYDLIGQSVSQGFIPNAEPIPYVFVESRLMRSFVSNEMGIFFRGYIDAQKLKPEHNQLVVFAPGRKIIGYAYLDAQSIVELPMLLAPLDGQIAFSGFAKYPQNIPYIHLAYFDQQRDEYRLLCEIPHPTLPSNHWISLEVKDIGDPLEVQHFDYGDWIENAVPSFKNMLKDTPWKTYSSWSEHSEEKESFGMQCHFFIHEKEHADLVIPYLSGQNGRNCHLKVLEAKNGKTLAVSNGMQTKNYRWNYFFVDLSSLAGLYPEGLTIDIIAKDLGINSDEWLAIGTPYLRKY